MASNFYTINDYLSFSVPSIDYLSYETITTIQFLSNKFGGYVVSEARPREKKVRSFSNKSSVDSWSAIRDFKPTVIIEKKEGISQWISDIRGSLNKISVKNYDVNSNIIIEKIREIRNSDVTSEEELKNVATNIFDIASTNKFFSEIYANLYKRLLDEFPDIFSSILDICIQGFSETMKTINYVDQNVNYDDFCKYNKDNDKRKATSVFITNLVKAGVLPISTVIHLIHELYEILELYMKEPKKLNEVEEITENIFLLLTNDSDILRKSVFEIKPQIQSLSQLKPKELPSMSSRAIFKYIDILEKMNKLV